MAFLLRTACRTSTARQLGVVRPLVRASNLRFVSTTTVKPSPGPVVDVSNAPVAPGEEKESGQQKKFLGTIKRMPEYNLNGKVVCVTGGARGLGLCMAEALLEAGAKVYALDMLPEDQRSPDFKKIADRAENELGTTLQYRQIDVRDVPKLNQTIESIGNAENRLDGLVAAAGIQQETPAIEYSQEDANRMFAVNITGVFMTSQAVAKQMMKFGNGGSIAMIASMSATVANKGLICSAYNASKAGVVQLGRNLAAEWGM